jgi:hypothetical protein
MTVWLGGLAATLWVLQDYKDPIDDHKELTAALEGNSVGLYVTCVLDRKGRGDKLIATFTANRHLGFDGWAQVQYRFDDLEPVKQLWDFAGKSVTDESGLYSRSFLEGLLTAKKLTFRAVDFERHAFDVIFPLPADNAPLQAVAKACPD